MNHHEVYLNGMSLRNEIKNLIKNTIFGNHSSQKSLKIRPEKFDFFHLLLRLRHVRKFQNQVIIFLNLVWKNPLINICVKSHIMYAYPS